MKNKIVLSAIAVTFLLCGCGNTSDSESFVKPEITSVTERSNETETSAIRNTTEVQSEVTFTEENASLTTSQTAAVTENITTDADISTTEEVSVTEVQTESIIKQESVSEKNLTVTVNGQTFFAKFCDNESVESFAEMLPVTIDMNDYSGFEKVGSLGQTLPTEDIQMTTQSGDIVLYNSNQIVVFYGSNSWSYTKLATIADLTGWEEALGDGSVEITFSIGE